MHDELMDRTWGKYISNSVIPSFFCFVCVLYVQDALSVPSFHGLLIKNKKITFNWVAKHKIFHKQFRKNCLRRCAFILSCRHSETNQQYFFQKQKNKQKAHLCQAALI